MQTILGSGGAIGIELAKALPAYNNNIRLVSRNPKKVNATDQLFPADLLDADAIDKAVEGSEIVYSTVGFPYNHKLWQEVWPKYTQNLINACIKHDSKLVFFDNIYMYDPNFLNGMTEETPINPPSKKGKVRAQILKMVLDKVEEGKLTALIARSADFYGPGIKGTSVLTEAVIDPLSKGKKATWMGKIDCKHSYTYTPDAGKATALLGNTPEAYNQTWHLPTADNPPTGKEWIHMIAKELDTKPGYMIVVSFMLKLIGVFVPVMREMPEMLYQCDRDYVFNSDKFNQRFNFKPTPYVQGIKEVVEADYKK